MAALAPRPDPSHTRLPIYPPHHLRTGVRTWCGDFLQLPTYLGSAGAITMNAVFGNLPDPREALLKAALLLQPGGYILISHPMGRAWHRQLHESDPGVVPHELPDQHKLKELTRGLPLQVVSCRDDPELYAAVLQVCVLCVCCSRQRQSGQHHANEHTQTACVFHCDCNSLQTAAFTEQEACQQCDFLSSRLGSRHAC